MRLDRMTWRGRAHSISELRRKATSVMAALSQDRRLRALHTWVEAASESAAQASRLRRASYAFFGSGLLRAWEAMKRVQRERMEALECMRTAIVALTRQGLTRAWLTWAGLTVDRRQDSLRALMSPTARKKRRAWNSLKAAAAAREAASKAVRRMRAIMKVRAFNSWVENGHRRQLMDTALRRLRYRRRSRAFRSWTGHSASGRLWPRSAGYAKHTPRWLPTRPLGFRPEPAPRPRPLG